MGKSISLPAASPQPVMAQYSKPAQVWELPAWGSSAQDSKEMDAAWLLYEKLHRRADTETPTPLISTGLEHSNISSIWTKSVQVIEYQGTILIFSNKFIVKKIIYH